MKSFVGILTVLLVIGWSIIRHRPRRRAQNLDERSRRDSLEKRVAPLGGQRGHAISDVPAVMTRLLFVLAIVLGLVTPIAPWSPVPAHAQAQDPADLQRIRSTLQSEGRARVIVELRLPAGQHVPEGLLGSQAAVTLQRQDIGTAAAQVISRVLPTGARIIHRYDRLPFVALDVDSAGLAQLQAAGLYLKRIMQDRPLYPRLFQSGPLVEAPGAWAAGFDGTGWAVAIVDFGVESTHPFLAGKVVSEACFVSDGGCPGGVNVATGTNSALPANSAAFHGTHMAGIAAGNAPNAVPAPPAPMTNTSSGIAKGAQIIAINVFGPFSDALTSDVMAALDHVYAVRSFFNIAAVNLSLGGDTVTSSSCDSDPIKTAIDQLRSVKIATIVAAGNDGATNGMNAPACVSTAVSVGSTDKTSVLSWFSNVSAFLSLLAPGGVGNGTTQDIYSSLLNGTYGPGAGTSTSVPHVTGAWAVLKQAAPTATVTEILTALQTSGLLVTDTRPGGSYTKPSIRIAHALALLVPLPASVSPTTAGLGATLNVVITGSNFQQGATVSFGTGVTINSAALNSSTQLTANITIQANAATGSRGITVTNPDGRFATLPNGFTITAPVPSITSLSPNPVSVGGGNFTLTVNGANFASNSVVRLNGSDRATTFVSASQLQASLLAGDIVAAGTQSITVFTPGGGTTPAVTLSVNYPMPALTSISPSTLTAWGPAFTLTATGTNFVNGSVVQVNGAARPTTYVSPTQLTAALPVSDLATTATSLTITVTTLSPGGGTTDTRNLTLTQPSVTVDNTTGPPGFTVTATLSNLPGNPNDWVAFAAVGSANPTYLQWTRVATLPGTTTKTWTFTLPAALGQYEVRFFLGDTYTRMSTSPIITVANISPTPTLASLTPAGVAAGSASFALTVTGTGFVSGATATVGGQARTVTWISPTQLAIAVLAGDVAAVGPVAVQVTNPAACVGGLCASNTISLSVTAPPLTPTLSSISPGTVAKGGGGFMLTVTGTNFAGNSVLQINGNPRATTFVSPTQLTASILASDIASAGTASITVMTPAPGGGTSNAQTLTITGPGLALSATTGPPGSALTVTLSNPPATASSWLALAAVGAANPTYLQYVFLDSLPGTTTKTWTVTLPTGLGQYEVRLFEGLTYNRVATSPAITVANISPTPTLVSLTPAGVAAGSASFALTVTGTGFVNGATATVGGQPRTVTGISPTQLTIAVLAGDVPTVGSVAVQVTNPAACVGGLCASNTINLSVTAPPLAPTLGSISPATVGGGGAAFTLTATGTNFAANSIVQINGSPRATTFVSPTQLTASILASDIASAGTASITVVTPAPGGGTSNAQTLTITGPGLALSATTGPPGSALTVTLSNPPATASSWLALAAVGAANPTYLQYVFLDSLPGTTTKTWTVTLPAGLGQYEVRLFEGLTYNRVATSPAITVANISPTPTLASLAPAGVAAGSSGFALTVTGTGLVSGATATVGGQSRTVTFNSPTQLTITVLPGDVATVGSVAVQVTNPAACVGGVCASNILSLSVTAPPQTPTLAGISPATVGGGGAAFTLTATGTNFAGNSILQVNGNPRATTFVSTIELKGSILASDIAGAGTASITVMTPAPGGGTSNALLLTITGPGLAISTTTGPPGSALTVTLSNPPATASSWLALAAVGAANPTYLQYVFLDSLPGTTTKTWVVTLPAALGQYEVRLFEGLTYNRVATSPTITVANISPTPSLASLAPAGVAAGSASFALTVTGTGFVSGATATVGGQARTVTFNSPTQLTIAVLAGDVAAVGSVAVQVNNPAACVGGLCASNTINLSVTAPPLAPTLGSISPSTVGGGGAAFTLTATGANFSGNSVVQINGNPRATTFVSATQLTASILASDIASAGTASITVMTPAPGGGTSNAQTLTITGPSLALSATTGPPGSALTVTLSNPPATPNSWLALAAVGAANPTYLQYVFLDALPGTTTKTWTVTLPTGLGQYEVRLFEGLTYNRVATSPAITVANISPTPTLASLAPAGVAAGSAGFPLVVTGTGFVNGATATVGGQARTVTGISPTQLTIAVLAGDVVAQGSVPVQVTNPAACVGGVCTSNILMLGVTAPPSSPGPIASISPATVAAGGPAFTLTVTGANFAGNSVVQVNGNPRATTFVSTTELKGSILASDIASAGTASITVMTPAPGGGTSNAQTLTITGPGLALSATTGPPGSALTVTLSNPPATASSWLALAAVGAANPTYLQYVFLDSLPGTTTKTWTVTLPAALGQYEVRLFEGLTYNRVATSPTITVEIISPTPTLVSLTPASVVASNSGFALTVTGTGFVSGATATVGGQPRTVTVISPTQLAIAVLPGDLFGHNLLAVQVTNPTPCVGGLCVSNTLTLIVTPQPGPPSLNSISPSTVGGGGPAFTLTVTGTGFAGNSVVQIQGNPRATTFVSDIQLTASILAGDIASPGMVGITVVTPGAGVSNYLWLTIAGPSLALSATKGPPGGALTVTLSNPPATPSSWLALAAVGAANPMYLQYVFIDSLPGTTTKTWTVNLPAALGQYEVRLFEGLTYNRVATSPTITVVNLSPTPTLVSLTPASVAAGSADFPLTVTGTGFVSGATATIGGQARTLTVISATQLTIAVLAADVTTLGSVAVQVTNPAPCVSGLCASNTLMLGLTAPPLAPTLSSISPSTVAAGSGALTLTVTGTNFAGNSVVQINGSPRTTTFVSTTQLTASILASDIGSGGTPSITVVTPPPGGGTSNALTLTIPGPSLTVSASSALTGESITVTLTNAPGGASDSLALALVGSPATSYLQSVSVGAGVTNRTWTVTMPNTGGSYEFRLYLNNSFTIAATSPAVAVTQDVRGIYSVSSTLTQTSCSNALRNGTFGLSGTFTVTTQTGGDFSGPVTLILTQPGVAVTVDLMLSATVLPTASNNISGVFTYQVRENGVLTRSGNGTAAGTAISNQLTLTVDAQDSALESCHTTGTITATK